MSLVGHGTYVYVCMCSTGIYPYVGTYATLSIIVQAGCMLN